MSRLILLLALAGLLAAPAFAQTHTTVVTDAAGDTTLIHTAAGDLVLLGEGSVSETYDAISPKPDIPITTSAFMWYAGKAALRMGELSNSPVDDSWDDANIGAFSLAFGDSPVASGSNAVSFGGNATGNQAFVFPSGSASGSGAIAGLGGSASGTKAVALGDGSSSAGDRSSTFGFITTANAYASMVIGRFNVLEGTNDTWVDTEPLFVAGNGTGAARSNALTLLKNGNLTIAGTLTESSDARLKEGVVSVEQALALVRQLRPVRYRFRDGTHRPTGPQLGLVAQEVQAVLPELVAEGGDGYLSVNYARLAAVLAGAVQEQQAQLEALHRRLARLEAALQSAALPPADGAR